MRRCWIHHPLEPLEIPKDLKEKVIFQEEIEETRRYIYKRILNTKENIKGLAFYSYTVWTLQPFVNWLFIPEKDIPKYILEYIKHPPLYKNGERKEVWDEVERKEFHKFLLSSNPHIKNIVIVTLTDFVKIYPQYRYFFYSQKGRLPDNGAVDSVAMFEYDGKPRRMFIEDKSDHEGSMSPEQVFWHQMYCELRPVCFVTAELIANQESYEKNKYTY